MSNRILIAVPIYSNEQTKKSQIYPKILPINLNTGITTVSKQRIIGYIHAYIIFPIIVAKSKRILPSAESILPSAENKACRTRQNGSPHVTYIQGIIVHISPILTIK